jgi:hypothetical protein
MVDDVASLKAWETTRARAEFAISAPRPSSTSRRSISVIATLQTQPRGESGIAARRVRRRRDTHRTPDTPHRQQRSRLSPQLFADIFACESSPLPALRMAIARIEEKWKVRPYLD